MEIRGGKTKIICQITKVRKKILDFPLFFLLVFFLILVSSGGSFSQQVDKRERDASFHRASVLYEQARYEEAIREYEQLIQEGIESGNIYYNLGNCYFKNGELGKAILYYEKAKRLIPDDRDLESNYKYVRSLVKDNTPATQIIWVVRVLEKFSNRSSINGVTIFLSILYVLIVLIIISSLYIHTVKKYTITITAFMITLFVISSIILTKKISLLGHEAIITAEKAEAKFEPFNRATTHFILHEGMKVNLLSSKDLWFKVKRSDEKIGWVMKDQLSSF